MEWSSERLRVHSKYPFRIARPGGSVSGRNVDRVIVRCLHDGTIGMGEASPVPYYGETLDTVEHVVQQLNRDASLIGDDLYAVSEIVRRLVDRFDQHRAAVSAIDAALHDWIGQKLGIPVWRLLGLSMRNVPATSMSIGLDEPEVMVERVREASGFSALKIKVGTDRDEETLALIREAVPEAKLRLDVNEGWTPDEALDRIEALSRFSPEFIEQPIPAGHLDDLRRIHEQSPIPIYADEDVVCPEDILRLQGCVSGVNIKLVKCGGIREALRMIHLSRAADLKIMLGCMAETSLGIAAAVSISSLVDLVDLDGHLLLSDEPFGALTLDGDRVLCHDAPGFGLSVRPDL